MTRVVAAVSLLLACAGAAQGEVLVRWDQDRVPAASALGVSDILVPAERTAAILDAAQKGYRVYVEVDTAALASLRVPAAARGGVVLRGGATETQVRRVRAMLPGPDARVLTLDERGTWPHVRLNAVTRRDDVLQVASRSAQPWLESNGALVQVAGLGSRDATSLLSYAWTPLTTAEQDEGPSVEHYLVAIAEAGSVGASLVLPLHPRLQRDLLLGYPDARRDWDAIRSYLAFYAWDVPRHYEPMASVGVVTADPLASFEMLNLLTRHNVPFALLRPGALPAGDLDALALVIVVDDGDADTSRVAADLAARGVTVVRGDLPLDDPNAFALDVRNRVGPERRLVDIWNGITVLISPRHDPTDGTMLLSLVNYAHEGRPVQVRVRGTFASVEYESPEDGLMLVPFTHRSGGTEFVVQNLRVGGRVFLRPESRILR